ncbi:histidine phosphatase family protein [soil metagenome]
MRLIFLRHGESASNAAPGAVDLPDEQGDRLTELGVRQAAAAAVALRDCGATRLLASRMRRAQQTAAPVAESLGLEVETDPGIHELRQLDGFGRLSAEEQKTMRWSEWMADHGDDPDYAEPGAESFNDVRRRVRAFKARLESGDPDQVVLAVSHGIFQRFFLFDSILGDGFGPSITRRTWQIRTVNCGVSIFQLNPKRHPLDPPVEGWLCLNWMGRWWDQP